MGGPKVVVTLVCTHADEDEVDDIVDGLRASGRKTKLVVGLADRPRAMAEAIERSGEWGLIVLCTSSRLSEDTRRKAEGMFSARRGPSHAMVRVDLGQGSGECVAAISRAYEGFVSSQGRISRRGVDDSSRLRELVSVRDKGGPRSAAAARLERSELLEHDAERDDAPENPKARELSRRRRAARERERERERQGKGGDPATSSSEDYGVELLGSRAALQRDEQRLDRMMIVMIIGAGLLAVLAAISFAG